jgi:hypothetical protein
MKKKLPMHNPRISATMDDDPIEDWGWIYVIIDMVLQICYVGQ